MKLEVYNIEGQQTGRQVNLPADIFEVEPNEHAVYLAVKQYLAHQRQGTHKSKERGEIAGSTRKIKRQKGTGTARAGSLKNPVFRGGGRIFGPRPRTYRIKLNKKVQRLARKSALSAKLSSGNIKVVEDFTFDTPKTKAYQGILQQLELSEGKTLLVTGELDQMVLLSSRNLPKATVTRAQDLNTYSVMVAKDLIISEGALEKIKNSFAQ
ncbi:MAG: 50S ribosomal protein L4 [Bacteroidota bacterium]